MTRIFTDGAEFGDVLFFDGTSQLYASAAQKRTGGYSYQWIVGYKNLSPALSEFYFRYAQYIDAAADSAMEFRASTTTLCSVRYTAATSKYDALVNNVVVASTTHTYPTMNTWHLLEVHLKIADAGDFEVKVDGILEIDYAGDTKPGADTTIDNIYRANNNSSYTDDLALNDTAGGADNSWCGDGHIELLTPVTGGTYQWTGSDGDSVDNYALVDDIPATGDDYVKDSTAGHQDIYSLSDFTGTGKIIQRVWAECRAKDNDATAGQIKLGMKSGGTTDLSASKTLSGNYTRVVGDEEVLNPADAGAWEDADLDALQFVVECE